MTQEHFDVLIVGAGLSGIGAGYHLQENCPGKSYVILEGRDCIGGTWDLFRYPGIRSDSDMYTLGYAFKPWTEPKAIADGPRILNYMRETAAENGIDSTSASTIASSARRGRRRRRAGPWRPSARGRGRNRGRALHLQFSVHVLGLLQIRGGLHAGVYRHGDFAGRIVHPQKWTEDIDYAGKRVVVIGSGATAVTLVPELAKTAAHVTMLQRSPTYVVARPAEDALANKLRRNSPRGSPST